MFDKVKRFIGIIPPLPKFKAGDICCLHNDYEFTKSTTIIINAVGKRHYLYQYVSYDNLDGTGRPRPIGSAKEDSFSNVHSIYSKTKWK